MPIDTEAIRVGGIYATPTNQHRRVTEIDKDGRVHYEARGGNVNSDWGPGATKANPPTLETFANACETVLSLPQDFKGDGDEYLTNNEDETEQHAVNKLGLSGVPPDELTDDARAAVADLKKQLRR